VLDCEFLKTIIYINMSNSEITGTIKNIKQKVINLTNIQNEIIKLLSNKEKNKLHFVKKKLKILKKVLKV
jgi:hypothetical protein